MTEYGSIFEAVRWVDGSLAGNFVFCISTIAVAGVGFALMSGRMDARKGAAVLLGCFLMIGAPIVARGVVGGGTAASVTQPSAALAPPAALPEIRKVQQSEDPYAGASLTR